MEQLNIPTKKRGDKVTHNEFNNIVSLLNEIALNSNIAKIVSATEYKAIRQKERIFYAVMDGYALDAVYFGTQLIARRKEGGQMGFSYSFPITF